MLTEQWLATVSEDKHDFREGINESMKLVNYELNLIHAAMKRKKLNILPKDGVTKEMVIEELKRARNREHKP